MITDNSRGMNMDTIKGPWMELGTAVKVRLGLNHLISPAGISYQLKSYLN